MEVTDRNGVIVCEILASIKYFFLILCGGCRSGKILFYILSLNAPQPRQTETGNEAGLLRTNGARGRELPFCVQVCSQIKDSRNTLVSFSFIF